MTAQPAPIRPTKSVVITSEKKMAVLPPIVVVGDRSVLDFLKWVENFSAHGNQSGHFCSPESNKDLLLALDAKISQMGGYIDASNIDDLNVYIIGEQRTWNWFISDDAADDFVRQVRNYVEIDEFIGVKPQGEPKNAGKSESRKRQRRKAS